MKQILPNGAVVDYDPIHDYVKKNPENWREVFGEQVDYLDWETIFPAHLNI